MLDVPNLDVEQVDIIESFDFNQTRKMKLRQKKQRQQQPPIISVFIRSLIAMEL